MFEQRDSIGSWRDLVEFLNEDCLAHDLVKWRPWMKFQYPELHYQRVLRIVEFLSNYKGFFPRLAWKMARIRLARLGAFYGISVPPGVFGRGLSIAHLGSIVVNNLAEVGRHCRIHSGTNIGEVNGLAPRIGNGVYIGPGAVIFGDVYVGSGAVIGANSVVTRSVPPNTVVAGVPAKVMRPVGTESPMPDWMLARQAVPNSE